MHKQIRLYKAVLEYLKIHNQQAIKNSILEFTNKEVQKNIEKYGVYLFPSIDNLSSKDCTNQERKYLLTYNRLQWVYFSQTDWSKLISIDHWPKRVQGNFQEVKILISDSNFLAIYKPSNVVTEKGTGNQINNLIYQLQENYQFQILPGLEKCNSKFFSKKFLKNLNPSEKVFLDPKEELDNQTQKILNFQEENSLVNKQKFYKAVHRLDKPTSGILLIAKNQASLDFLQDQFRQRLVIKKYLAVLQGLLKHNLFITNWQSRDQENPVRQKFFWSKEIAINYSNLARESKSKFRPLVYCKQLKQTLVQIQILTGRQHQIRLQAENLGIPILGEKVYTQKIDLNFEELKQKTDIDQVNNFRLKKNKLINCNLDNKNQSLKIYPNFKIKELELKEFENLKLAIFGQTDLYLLANYLECQINQKSRIAIEWINLQEIFNQLKL